MTWRDLADVLRRHELLGAAAPPPPSGAITAVSYDSRTVQPGAVFVALKGRQADGTAFAREAIARGAAGIVSEAPAPQGPGSVAAPWFTVTDARAALARLAAAFYGHPSDAMRVVGITGTNGKTTTAYLTASIFEAAGVACGIARHGGLSRRRRDPAGDPHHARGAGAPGHAARDGGHRVRRLRDGSVVARPRAPPRGRPSRSRPASSRT